MEYISRATKHSQFVTKEELQTLHDFATKQFNDGMFRHDVFVYNKESKEEALSAKSKLRWSLRLDLVSVYYLEPLVDILTNRIVDCLNLKQYKHYVIDPLLGFRISILKPGSFIQLHNDKYDNKSVIPSKFYTYRHIRFNIMVDRDKDISYNPHFIINDSKFSININSGDAWCFPADAIDHFMPFVTGTKDRIVYQFGFAIGEI